MLKAITLDQLSPDAWTTILGQPEEPAGLTTIKAFRRVPHLYRAVSLRSLAARDMPLSLWRGANDVTEAGEGEVMLPAVRNLLQQMEMSRCIYGAAYALKVKFDSSYALGLRWVVSPSITIETSERDGLIGFRRRAGSQETRFRPEDVVYSWEPAADVEIGPGPAPVAVALMAAGVITNTDQYVAAFFAHGAVRATIWTVEGNPTPDELSRFERWLNRSVTGVRNAFRHLGIRTGTKRETLGDSLSDTVNPELNRQAQEDMLAALGVPLSLVLSNAANYATAQQDALAFLTNTVIPQTQSIIDAINEQHLARLGLRLYVQPERLEAMQQSELAKAASLAQLVGTVLTQGEARERMELEPIASDASEEARALLVSQLQVIKAGKDAGLNAGQIADLASVISFPVDMAPQEMPALPEPSNIIDVTPEPEPMDMSEAEPVSLRAIDLGKWERKAIKRGGAVSFESDHINTEDAALISDWLTRASDAATIKAVFSAVSAEPGAGLTPSESLLFGRLTRALAQVAPDVLAAIERGEDVDLTPLEGALRNALLSNLTSIALDTGAALAQQIGPDLDPTQAATVAGDWARTYTYDLVRGLVDSTRKLIQQAVGAYQDTPGMDRATLANLLAPAFGKRRAETIAITEATRAAAAATGHYQATLAAAGLKYIRAWDTVNDEGVCAVCDPLNGKREGEWGTLDGPPAHPRCRCNVTLRRAQ